MEFHWQQLLTHALGFLITLWILKKFAWGPLLSMMDERRNTIVNEFKRIDEQKAAAARLAADYEAKLRDIENERRAKVAEAVNEGKRLAEEIRSTARHEAGEIAAKAKTDLARELAKARVELKEEMVSMTMSATQRIIGERLDDTKHRELIGRFLEAVPKA